MAVRAVWFDVGEVLIDETREYGAWADWLDVPCHTFSAVFGAVLAPGEVTTARSSSTSTPGSISTPSGRPASTPE